jgi:serine/threonine protein kinase
MKGGKYLGEGTYGCTMDPAPQCKGPEQSVSHNVKIERAATVGKVFTDGKHFREEWETAREIAAIDPKQQYFIYPVTACTTTPKDVRNVEGYGMCRNVSRKYPTPDSRGTINMIRLPNGGETMNHLVMHNLVSPTELLRAMLPVFKGVQKLGRHGIVHHDLKFDNILYDSSTKECRIIDFGLKVPMDVAVSINNKYIHSNYWLHPPEYKMFVTMLNRNWKDMDDADIRTAMARHLSVMRVHFHARDPHNLSDVLLNGKVFAYCDYEQAYLRYMRAMCKRKNISQKMEYIKKHPQKVDVYGLGVTLLYLAMYLDFTKVPAIKEHQYWGMIRNMVHPDPRKRWTITRCLREATAYVQ